MEQKVKLISITPNTEKTIAYCARVSNPANQENPDVSKLLSYCIKNQHWSIFEMANMVVEITTTRAIAQQILRHRSFSFQEFSLRYAEAFSFAEINPRRQDLLNRQNSIDDLSEDTKKWFATVIKHLQETCKYYYDEALKKNIAKECARFLLPLCTNTKIYMNGTIRSWIHYLQLRTKPETQLEHREIANLIKDIFIQELPVISKALDWKQETK